MNAEFSTHCKSDALLSLRVMHEAAPHCLTAKVGHYVLLSATDIPIPFKGGGPGGGAVVGSVCQ